MIMDDDGFIWLAADKGLFRYNGKEYTNYSHPNKRGLSVFNLQKDHKGRIWCSNVSGQFFYIENDVLHLFFDIKDRVKTTQLPVFTTDENDGISISTDEGLYHVDFSTKKIKELTRIKNNLLKIPPNIARHSGDVFFFNDSILQFRNGKFHQSYTFDSNNIYNRFFSFNNTFYFISSREKYFTPSGINETTFYKIEPDSGKLKEVFTPLEIRSKTIINVSEIDNRVWFNTNDGTFVYQIVDGTWIFQKRFYEKRYTTRVVRDNNDNYWIATLRNGIYVIPNLSINRLETPQGIQNITSLSVVKDNLIYGTDKGCIIVNNLETGATKAIELFKGLRVLKMAYNNQTNVLFICGDVQSYLWDLNTGNVKEAFEVRGAKDLSTVNANLLLISNHNSVSLLDYSNYQINTKSDSIDLNFRYRGKLIRAKDRREMGTVRSYTNLLRKDSSIYIGQIDKLYFIDKKGSKKEVLYMGNSIFATDIAETNDGIIWVSTNENGIFGLRKDKVVFNYNKSNGLQTDQALKVLADKNDVWVVTNKGLHFFDRNEVSFKSFSFKSEIPIQKISGIKNYRDKIYLSGNSGIFIVDKSYLKDAKKAPEVYFESVVIGNENKGPQNEYTTSYKENSFEARFNANFYNSKESLTYLYRLRGIEKDWKETNTGVVRYPSLPSGNYTFEVRAITNKGVSTKEIKTIELFITTPFWNQWWFYLLIIFIGIGYFRFTIKRVRKKQEEKLEKERVSKKLVFSQLENLRSQMNPHFIFNVLNSIQEYIVRNDKYAASTYLVEFSKLIRMYLDHSRKEEIQLNEELSALKIYLGLEKNRFDNDFAFSIQEVKGISPEKLYVPSLFLQPYVENAIKHGLLHKREDKELSVKFDYKKEHHVLVCIIEDNGVGREASKSINKANNKYHTSFATKANNNRVDLLNRNRKRKIEVQVVDNYNENSEPVGTKVIISIPQHL
ncbi:histidine kinase [Flavobacteriaceae bacterium S356]|uniref:Histidine kinase n=1 Tax=Asprobacillus argus TaxID=3076534 RepID=A0ABU3LET0_9FLAO|nr:histidine kinase [Flavobacteriaceae bacterium S356]